MTVSAAKPEEKRLLWFAPSGVDEAESCVKPVEGAKNAFSSRARIPDQRTTHLAVLIWMQNGINMGGKAFYLGNVG
jgi:hypothetical protein